jgi:hypothetical protein
MSIENSHLFLPSMPLDNDIRYDIPYMNDLSVTYNYKVYQDIHERRCITKFAFHKPFPLRIRSTSRYYYASILTEFITDDNTTKVVDIDDTAVDLDKQEIDHDDEDNKVIDLDTNDEQSLDEDNDDDELTDTDDSLSSDADKEDDAEEDLTKPKTTYQILPLETLETAETFDNKNPFLKRLKYDIIGYRESYFKFMLKLRKDKVLFDAVTIIIHLIKLV